MHARTIDDCNTKTWRCQGMSLRPCSYYYECVCVWGGGGGGGRKVRPNQTPRCLIGKILHDRALSQHCIASQQPSSVMCSWDDGIFITCSIHWISFV